MKLIAAIAVSAMFLMGQGDRSASSVTAVRHWSLADVTRVAVEVTGPFEFRTEHLHNPDRVYFDILNSRPLIESKRNYGETVSDKMLQRIRVAETTPGVTRVVLDLNGNAVATTSTLRNPDRLIIELRAPAANAPHTEAPPADPSDRSGKPAPAPAKAPVKTEAAAIPSPEATKPEDAPADNAGTAPPPEEIAQAAKPNSSGGSSLIRTLGLKINRVVIDAGHGGQDAGTEGPKGLPEKDVVLDVALRVGKLVQDRMGAEVIYTREDDSFVPLERRTALANEKRADLFLSIHANSSPASRISGVETYYLNINGSKDAMDVAARENGPAQSSIFELQDIIRKIALHDKSEESREFAQRVEASLYAFSLKYFPGTKDRGVKSAPFVVLIGANMPSVLAEIGFVSNPKEEALLRKPDYRQKLAEALYKGMEKYTESLSHFRAAARP